MTHFARRIFTPLFCLGALASFSATASAAFIPVFSTGTTATGALAATGTADTHYALVAVPAGAGTTAYVGTNLPSVWVANTSTSQWLAPAMNASTTEPSGTYDYQTKFSLAGLDASTAVISGLIAADDIVTIMLNGVNKGTFTGFSAFSNFSLTSGFVAGSNTLDFMVTNSTVTTFNPTGLQVNITSATANAVVPEPASIVLVSLGGIAALGFGLRRRAIA